MNIPAFGKCYLCLERDVLVIESHIFPVQFGKTVTGGRGKDDTFLVHPGIIPCKIPIHRNPDHSQLKKEFFAKNANCILKSLRTNAFQY